MSIGEVYEAHDAVGLAELVAAGDVHPDELLDEALKRAEALNPHLNALTMLREDVARTMIRDGLPEGPLRGVPFLLKDLGAAAVDFPSNNGSALLLGTQHPMNSALYDRLAASGLVTFGRTTAPEGGMGPVTEARIYGGPTRNPWNLDHTSGGSSGGTGAAVASGIVPAAHGSDGGGSVRIPASSCGLFGFKATRARLPSGPYAGEGWAGMAMDGFLTRSVRDTAVLLDATAGADPGAPYWAPPMAGTYRDAMADTPRSLRIAVVPTTLGEAAIDPECRTAVENTAKLLEGLGHHVEEAGPAADIPGMTRAWIAITACGTALWVNRKLASLGRDLEPGDVEPIARGARAYAQSISGEDYLNAVEKIHGFGREMAAFFDNYDVLVTATLAEPPAKIGRFAHVSEDFVDYRMGENGVFAYSPFTGVFNASGQPAASLPLHWTGTGLPVGVHLASAFGADEMLMSLCAQIEQAQPWFDRRPPLRYGQAMPD